MAQYPPATEHPSVGDLELVARASELVGSWQPDGTETRLASVGCAMVTPDGRVFEGVSIVMHCGMGFCAEHSAAAAMVAAGASQVHSVVAVQASDQGGVVLPPCGRCREFLRLLDPRNLSARVLLPGGEVRSLSELLPLPW